MPYVTDKLHLAIDLDDVVLDFTGGLRTAVQTEYGVNVDEFDKWEIREVLDPILGRSWWKWMRERDWLWPNFPVIPGAIGGLTQLRSDGHRLEIVTSKPEWAEYAVWKWMGKWRPPVHAVTIMNTGNGDRKVDATDADLLIDDRADSVVDFAEEGRVGILFDRPHNRADVKMPSGTYRATDWHKVVELVRLEARGELE